MATIGHMEQLTKLPFELEALAKGADGSLSPFLLKITKPAHDDDRGYFCVIACPLIRDKEMKIFGEDAEQAAELAFQFVSEMLQPKGVAIVDSHGNSLDVPWG